MYTDEESKRRFEILKMAKEMLNEEYKFKRATDHNKWLADSQELWTKHHVTLAHPPFAPYPSEHAVLAAAKTLYEFISNDQPPIKEPESTLVPDPAIEETENEHDTCNNADSDNTITNTEHYSNDDSIIPAIEPLDKEVPPTGLADLLPGWIRRPVK